MGRKKKVIQPETKAVKVVEDTPLKYSGQVTINLKHGNKTYKTIKTHNAGGNELWKFLCSCLAEEYNLNSIPNFITIYSVTNPTTSRTEQNLLYYSVPVSNKVISNNNGKFSTVYTILIGNNNIKFGNLSELAVGGFYMVNKNNVDNLSSWGTTSTKVLFENYSMKVDTLNENNEGFKITKDTNIEIVWALSISNPEVSE